MSDTGHFGAPKAPFAPHEPFTTKRPLLLLVEGSAWSTSSPAAGSLSFLLGAGFRTTGGTGLSRSVVPSSTSMIAKWSRSPHSGTNWLSVSATGRCAAPG